MSKDHYQDQGIIECPHCGSSAGFSFVKVVYYEQQMTFSGKPIHASGDSLKSYNQKTKRCIDCGRVIRL